MNVFYLSENPKECAEQHCDKHVVKMIIEYAQLMSTAHRMLDGTEYEDRTANGRRIRRWRMSGNYKEALLYKASHINHPSAIWARLTSGNYLYLYELFCALCDEYTYRYGKVHKTDSLLRDLLCNLPDNMVDAPMTEVPQAMPDDVKTNKPLDAYHKYYREYKSAFAKWTNREIPHFMHEGNAGNIS